MQARAFFHEFKKEWAADRITDVAAMMTYYAVFALFPMLVFVVTVSLIIMPAAWIDSAMTMAAAALPAEVGTLLRDQLAHMESAAGAGFAIGSALLALWGASRGAAALMLALDDMFEKKESRPWWRRQVVAIGATLSVALLLVVAMSILAAGPAVGHAIADRFGLSPRLSSSCSGCGSRTCRSSSVPRSTTSSPRSGRTRALPQRVSPNVRSLRRRKPLRRDSVRTGYTVRRHGARARRDPYPML